MKQIIRDMLRRYKKHTIYTQVLILLLWLDLLTLCVVTGVFLAQNRVSFPEEVNNTQLTFEVLSNPEVYVKPLGIVLILLGRTLFISLWISYSVTHPMQKLTATIQAIASGEKRPPAEESGPYEVMTLARHFNGFNRALQEKIDSLKSTRVQLIDRHAEECKQAHDALMSCEQRYFGLLNFAVDGILLGTYEGIVTNANECACELFGLKREQIIGKHINEMPFTEQCLKKRPFRFDLVYQGEAVVSERVIRRTDGSEVIVEIHSKIMPDGTLQSIYHDISERKRAEKSLEETCALLEDVQHLAELGGWKYDVIRRQSQWTDEVFSILGVGRDFDKNDPAKTFCLFSPESRSVLIRAWQRAVELAEPYQLDLALIRPSGEKIWVRINTRATIEDGRVVGLTGNIMDITERVNVQRVLESMNQLLEQRVEERTKEVQRYVDQLRVLTDRLIHVEESERRRFTQVLHEDLQQVLVASRMTLEVPRASVKSGAVADSLGRVDSMLSEAIQLTRTLVREISVPAVKEGELPVVVRWVAQQMKEKFGLTVDVVVDEGVGPVSENVYLCVYRALQEILFNVVKHAQVSQAGIVIEKASAQSVRVTVRDGGKGFTIREGSCGDDDERGVGLFGIRQSVEGVGGKVDIMSVKGDGTAIVLTVPVREEKKV